MGTKEEKRIYAIGIKAYKLFNDLRDRCYADDLDEFDKHHDNLYYQALGIKESLWLFRDDVKNDSDVSEYESEFKEALDLARKLDRYHKKLLKQGSVEFNWIYA